MNLISDCLDKQLVDRTGHKMGRVDGIIFEWQKDRQPTVKAIEVGVACQLSRLHPKLKRVVRRVFKWTGIPNDDSFRLPWSKIVSAGIEVIADVEAEKTPALAWELWLRKKVIERIPGG